MDRRRFRVIAICCSHVGPMFEGVTMHYTIPDLPLWNG
jgi:hypothetical protein